MAGGLYNIGPSLGSMLAPPLVAWAILNYSWQASFVIVGLISLVWVALWLIFYRPVRQHPTLSEEERNYITSGQESFLPKLVHLPFSIARQSARSDSFGRRPGG